MIRSKFASRFKRATTMGFFWALVTLVLHVLPGAVGPAHAQGTRKDDIVFNSRGIPLAGATVRVCAMPASGQPCTPLAQIYSDSALTQAIANPTTTDGLGNYFFYAVPGKYEIEVSGPGITTKQLPNVILPSDPTSPTFSGAVSAFSLNLSGNLSVTGNTTIIGNLASGTLNLSNQSTPPGAAGTGTVNLYTKTADKRLYYKDETGTETGPIGPGAQTNTQNTFTAQQNVDADFHTKGPNPWFDLARFGGYSSPNSTPPTITCATTNGSNTMTCSGGVSDFLIGHGVAIPTAGPPTTTYVPGAPVPVINISVSSNVATVTAYGFSIAGGTNGTIAGSSDSAFNGSFTFSNTGNGNLWTFPVTHANCNPCTIGSSATLAAPVAGQVTPQGILNGSTTYNYKIVAMDANGGLSAASAAFTTTTGAATLGINNATIAVNGCTHASGLLTFTTTAPHNFQNGVEVNILRGSTSGSIFNGQEGAFTIFSVPSSTTFTVEQIGVPDGTFCPNGGTAQVVAKNLVQWPLQAYTAIKSYIYRSVGAGAYSLVGVTQGMDGSFTDWGTAGGTFNPAVLPAYVPATPPTSSTNGYLQTTITNILGNTVTLAANAGATVGSATVLHDNAANVIAACTSSGFNGVGGTIYFPGSNPQGNLYLLSSPLKMSSCPSYTRLLLGAPLWLNEPILSGNAYQVEGLGQGGSLQIPSFVVNYTSLIEGHAYPFFLLTPGSGNDVTFTNLLAECNQFYQSCFVQDQDSLGNNVTSVTYNNVTAQGNFGQPVKWGGGFGFNWTFGSISVGGETTWGFQPQFLDVVQQGLGATTQQLASIVYFNKVTIGGGEMLFDAGTFCNRVLSAGPGHMDFTEILDESGFYPILRFNTCGGNIASSITIEKATMADQLGGLATPLIDLTTANSISSLRVADSFCNQGPLFAMGSQGGVEIWNGANGCNVIGAGMAIVHSQYGASLNDAYVNVPAIFMGANGLVQIQMNAPAAPSASAVSGGTLPAATYAYKIIPNDVNGNQGPLSPASVGVTVNGSQQVSLTWTPVPGQVSTTLCRSFNGNGFACSVTGAAYQITGNSFTDNLPGFNFSGSVPILTPGASSAMGPSGIQTNGLKLTGSGFATTLAGNFTASRTQTLPDNTGYVPVTSYLNSAYDNATRANGAIGSNWTVQQNGLNIASNQVQGTTGGASNTAFWNASPFASSQFAQVTITALNGTSDYPGVTVLASGTSGTSTYYDCVENSTNIYIQRVLNAGSTNLTSGASTGSVGDLLRLEVAPGGALTCYKNGVATLTVTDTQITSGSPGLFISGNVATVKNWSGGNLHPIGQLDMESDYTKVQHLNAGIGMGSETFTASPRAEQNVFLPGALTSTWTGATWTTDKAVTITRLQVQAKTAPSGCTTNAVVRLTDGTTPVNVTISAAANDSGSISQNYAAGSALQILVQTAAAGCTTSPADANVVVQYRMQ